MELDDYLRALRGHWVGVAVIALAAVAGATVFSVAQPEVYAANATGFVSTGRNENAALGSVSDSLAKSRVTSYVDIAQSRATAHAVIEDLDLPESPQTLIGRIDVVQPPETVLLKVTARGPTPEQAQQLADAWVQALAAQVQAIENPSGKKSPGTLRVVPVEAAALPDAPVSPNIPRNLALALALGLLLGFGFAVVRSLLDRRLRSVADVEERFDANVMGSIPLAPELTHASEERAPIAVRGETARPSGAAEAFRKLRTNLRFMNVDSPPRIIVVTSPQSGDGKSTTAINLAAAVGFADQDVVLVDGDLRRPSIAPAFGLVEGAGLTDVLAGDVDVEDLLQPVADVPGLKVLASGSIPPNPSELLGSQAMRSLLHRLAQEATVIVDAPPLLPVTDAAVLAAGADGALVVISAGKSLDTELGASLNHLSAANGKTLGVILNRVAKRGAEAGYYRSDYYRPEPAADGTSTKPLQSAPLSAR